MEIKEGYKKTKIGWIPGDWALCTISDITLEHKQGYYTKDSYTINGTHLIRITDLENPFINFEQMPKVQIDNKTFEQFKVEKGDFIFARSGAIGRYGIMTSDNKAVFASYLIRFRFNQDIAINKYIGYFYESKFSIRQILSITQGSSNININANNIKSLNIPLPPLPEQQKIAKILTTVDDKISSIEDQIQQTEQLKKGLMEKLLTEGVGHTEFKDTKIGRIPKSWGVVQLKDVGKFLKGKGISKKELSGNGLPCVRYGEIYTKHNIMIKQFYSFINPKIASKSIEIKTNDILFAGSGETAEDIGKAVVYLGSDSAYAGGDIIILRPNNIDGAFLSYQLNSQIFIRQRRKLGQGNAVVHIYSSTLKNLRIVFPIIKEQKKIATILSIVDDKLDVLQSKKTSYETLKKGLMEQTLTGERRVKL